MKKQFKLYQGDNMKSLDLLPDNSIDSVVTDPPYGLSFMGKKWDYDVPSVEFWKKVYQKLKPGGHVLSFGGTRTYHRMVVNIEDAGFEIRDQIMWLYGSGFPKSHNIGKAVDKLQGNDREVVGDKPYKSINTKTTDIFMDDFSSKNRIQLQNTKGQSPYEGWGTALKPANEPICVARKPLSEKSVAENVLKWGTGGINIDGCRVGSEMIKTDGRGKMDGSTPIVPQSENYIGETHEGRFPANIILECLCDEVIKGEKGEVKKSNRRFEILQNKSDGKVERTEDYGDKGDIHTNPMCPCYLMDEQSGVSKSRTKYPEPSLDNLPMNHYEETKIKHEAGKEQTKEGFADKGGASRFFYQAKVSKAERNMGLDVFEGKKLHSINQLDDRLRPDGTLRETPIHKNNHPTVKPVSLMAYLCRLVTPPNGIVLDPFMGSGSTGIAAQLEGFRFVGMEQDKSYFDIASARIENFESYRKFTKK